MLVSYPATESALLQRRETNYFEVEVHQRRGVAKNAMVREPAWARPGVSRTYPVMQLFLCAKSESVVSNRAASNLAFHIYSGDIPRTYCLISRHAKSRFVPLWRRASSGCGPTVKVATSPQSRSVCGLWLPLIEAFRNSVSTWSQQNQALCLRWPWPWLAFCRLQLQTCNYNMQFLQNNIPKI